MDLFSQPSNFEPLASRMRPKTLSDYRGQEHILAPGTTLWQQLEQGKCHSMILWGPPGTGKTTLAELVASHVNAHVERISAVTSGVKEIRAAITNAKNIALASGKQTLLFVDEVHRFNKSQQDAFLPFIEDGTVLFIGATTENPSFELNRALLSRARVYQIKPLDKEKLSQLLKDTLANRTDGLGERHFSISDEALAAISDFAAGDARSALNLLEICTDGLPDGAQITLEQVTAVQGHKPANYDKGGDAFYDLISAFHKSVRGSSPDGALYWYSRILVAGGEPLYVARRLLAIASEDIGNADPNAMSVVNNAWDCFHKVGPSEGNRAIAQAAVYCAMAPKSNAVYRAFNDAMALAQQTGHLAVPNHLKNAPTKLMADMGFGEDYRYAHNEPGAFAAGEKYLPEELDSTELYQPTDRGFEKRISEKLQKMTLLNQQAEVKRYE